jgi:hypothetical protein
MPTGTSTTNSAGSGLAGVLVKWSISPTSQVEARTRTRSRDHKGRKDFFLESLEGLVGDIRSFLVVVYDFTRH